MFASIVPIQRLPKGLGIFDYHVPVELESQLRIGQLVEISFRKKIGFGIVRATTGTPPVSTKKNVVWLDVLSIVHQTPLLTTTHLDLLSTTAGWYGVSIATMVKLSLLPLQKRNIKKIILTSDHTASTPTNASHSVPPTVHLYHTTEDHQSILTRLISGKTLILVPEVHHIDEVMRLLPAHNQTSVTIWHSALSTKEQCERWIKIKNDETNLIIGTRSAVFLPLDHLDTIIIDYEHDDNHKQWDQSPRWHTKDVSRLWASRMGAVIHLASFSMAEDTYYGVYKQQFVLEGHEGEPPPATLLGTPATSHPPILIDMRDARKGKNYGLLSDTVQQAILHADGDIFLFLNRRGFSTSIGCHDCGFIARCATCDLPYIFHESTQTMECHYCHSHTPMLRFCPTCAAPLVERRGAGTELLEADVRRLLGGTHHYDIIRIDSDTQKTLPYQSKKSCIIIGTEMAFPHIRWPSTAVIIFVDVDNHLSIPEYLATEHVWHQIQEVEFRRRPSCQLYLQTFHPDHLVFRSLVEPDRFFRTDLNNRRLALYPPYRYITRYMIEAGSLVSAIQEAERVKNTITIALQKESKSCIVAGPIDMHPQFFRGRYWSGLLIKYMPESWSEDLLWINQFFPNSWRIDPNPISILSP